MRTAVDCKYAPTWPHLVGRWFVCTLVQRQHPLSVLYMVEFSPESGYWRRWGLCAPDVKSIWQSARLVQEGTMLGFTASGTQPVLWLDELEWAAASRVWAVAIACGDREGRVFLDSAVVDRPLPPLLAATRRMIS